MDEEKHPYETYDFPGITLLVPEQVGDQIMAIEKETIDHEIPGKTPSFTVIRMIANIALVKMREYKENKKTIFVDSFKPPIKLYVGYHFIDLMRGFCKYEELKLAYWDGKEWVLLSDKLHDYLILPPSTGQVAEVTIRSWSGDPPVAWGK